MDGYQQKKERTNVAAYKWLRESTNRNYLDVAGFIIEALSIVTPGYGISFRRFAKKKKKGREKK